MNVIIPIVSTPLLFPSTATYTSIISDQRAIMMALAHKQPTHHNLLSFIIATFIALNAIMIHHFLFWYHCSYFLQTGIVLLPPLQL